MPRRRTLERIAVPAGGLVCAGVAVAILTGALGDDGDRTEALLMFLPFGLALLAYPLLAPAARRRPKHGPAIRPVDVDGVTRPARVYEMSRGRQRLGLLVCLAFVVAGIGLAIGGERLIGIGCAVVFGAMVLLGARNAFGGPTFVALTADGLVQRVNGGSVFVRWEDVVGVRTARMRSQEFLVIDAGGRVVHDIPGPQLLLDRVTPRRWRDVAVAEDLLEDPDGFEAAVRRCVDDPAARASIASA